MISSKVGLPDLKIFILVLLFQQFGYSLLTFADGRSSYPDLDKGGALQISVQAFQVDYYPYHLAKSDRSHWAKYVLINQL